MSGGSGARKRCKHGRRMSERYEQMSQWTSEWPSTWFLVILDHSALLVREWRSPKSRISEALDCDSNDVDSRHDKGSKEKKRQRKRVEGLKKRVRGWKGGKERKKKIKRESLK